MKLKPYLGITGCSKISEVIKTIQLFNKYYITLQSEHIPMLGFLVSYKWQKSSNYFDCQTHSKRYPTIKDLFELLHIAHNKVFTTIHYNTKNPYFANELISLLNINTPYGKIEHLLNGIQLNISKPNPKEINIIKKSFPHISIIFQLNNSFIKDSRFQNSDTLVKFININYSDVQYILLDVSGGRGSNINLNFTSSLYNYFKRNNFFNIGFAGGFNGTNIKDRIKKLRCLTNTYDFSIDAEGKLRDSNDNYSLIKAEVYIRNFKNI